MNSTFKNIIIIGDLCLDVIIPYAEVKNTLKTISAKNWDIISKKKKVIQRTGGSAANVAVVASKLGLQPYFITLEGNDTIGTFLKDEMIKQNVNMQYSIKADHGSIVCIAVIDENNDRTIFEWCPPWSKYDSFKKEYFNISLTDNKNIFFFSGMAINDDYESACAILDFLSIAKSKGSIIVFDLNLRFEMYGLDEKRYNAFRKAILLADYLLGSGIEEFGPITGKADLLDAAESIRRENLVIIIRDQSKPVLVFDGYKDIFSVDVPKVKQVNTIGAGDTFNAAFLKGIFENLNLYKVVEYANYIASFKVSSNEHLAIPLL